jgi:hypothetical protein
LSRAPQVAYPRPKLCALSKITPCCSFPRKRESTFLRADVDPRLRGGDHTSDFHPARWAAGPRRLGRFPMPGDVKFDTRVAPLRSPNRRRLPPCEFDFDSTQKAVFWPLFWVRLHSKTSSFLAPKNANSFLFNNSFGSFPLFSIFFHFPRLFPPCRVHLVLLCHIRSRLPALSCDNQNRLPRVGSVVKRKVQVSQT